MRRLAGGDSTTVSWYRTRYRIGERPFLWSKNMVRRVAHLLLFVSSTVALGVNGFHFSFVVGGVRGVSQQHPFATKRQRLASLLSSSTSSTSSTNSDDIGTGVTSSELSRSELKTLFKLLSDTTILYDPSRGTCCRNKCSGCTFLDPSDGNFIYDEYTVNDDSNEIGGWIAPYVKLDFGERVHISQWSQRLFPGPNSAREIERTELAFLLGERRFTPLALLSLWNVISPSPGYPRLSLAEISRAIQGMEGSAYEMGGALNFSAFETNMHNAAQHIVQFGGVDKLWESDTGAFDYDSMSKEELLEECVSRGMRTTFPKMKRIIIEELRFYDANGRQGKRHPAKNTLS